MYLFLVILVCCHFLLPITVLGQVRHPQELHIDIEDDLLNWTEKKSNKVDCSIYYMRLVKHLLSKKFQVDSRNPDFYIATVPLRLNKEQFELLVNQDVDGLNLNEIDDLIAEVVKQSNDDDWDYPVAQILFDHYRQQLVNSLPHINTPMVQIVIAVLIIIGLNRIYHFSRIKFSALILIVLLAICVLSYSFSYYDCLSDLEVEQMIQLSKQESTNNPCKDYHGEHESFFASMRTAILGSSENKCLEHMKKTFKPSKTFCDPLDVFAKWFAKIQMSYFSSVFGGFLELLTNATSSSNFLSKTIYWVAGFALFIYLIMSFGKSIIKHSFKGMFKILSTTNVTDSEPSTNRTPDYGLLHSKMDEILFENRQMKRELSIIRECSVERSLLQSTEAIEGGSKLASIEEEEPHKNN